jgi:hypothetical protein
VRDFLARSQAFSIRLFWSSSSFNLSEEVGQGGGMIVEIVTPWIVAEPRPSTLKHE